MTEKTTPAKTSTKGLRYKARSSDPREVLKKKFLDGIRSSLSVQQACINADINRRTIYHWKKNDPDFAEEWQEAYESGTDLLEDIAVQRAAERSDQLMIFMLRARRPEKYTERAQIYQYNTHNIVTSEEMTEDEWESQYSLEAPKGSAESLN